MNNLTLRDAIDTKKNIFLCGIGGISMHSLAIALKDMGALVSGSDRDDSPVLKKLNDHGIKTYVGHNSKNITGSDFIVKTAAVLDTNPEIAAAIALGIPVIERAAAWGVLMGDYAHRVCVAGTHGKTSTTSMIATVAIKGGLDPTIMVGGNLSLIGGSMRMGSKDLFIAEACEYKNSYHSFLPTISVILNVDRDHLDFFSDTDDIISSFRHFAIQVPKDRGLVIANYDDLNTMIAVEGIDRAVRTFGMSDKADVYADFVKDARGFFSCSIYNNHEHYCDIRLVVPGKHNLLNALATAAVAIELGMSGDAFKSGIQGYSGVSRRFEYKTTCNDALVFDEYSHHPSEIVESLTTANGMSDGRTICIFQPHTYTRTESLMDDFARALLLADIVVLTDIYSAREVNTHGTNAKMLADKIPGAYFFETFSEIADFIKETARKDDIVITMGAGDIYKVCDLL